MKLDERWDSFSFLTLKQRAWSFLQDFSKQQLPGLSPMGFTEHQQPLQRDSVRSKGK